MDVHDLTGATALAGPDRADSGLVKRIDASLARAARFLVERQSPDGAFRTADYGCFRTDPALTPYVMSCLFFMPQGGSEAKRAFRRGVEYLTAMVREDGGIAEGPRGLNFPVYTAASASRSSTSCSENSPATSVVSSYIRSSRSNCSSLFSTIIHSNRAKAVIIAESALPANT